MTWLAPLFLALVAAAILWRAGIAPLWLGAMLLLGGSGYIWAGAPREPGSPTAAVPPEAGSSERVEAARQALARDPVNIAGWGAFADALSADGRSGEAVDALTFASRTLPTSADLQVFLGTALLNHAEGVMTPAAQLAFARAEAIDPEHPAPAYFTGLAYLQQGDPSAALGVWEPLMQRTPPDAPWRADLERKIRGATAMRAAGVGQ